jgi:cytochrome P450
MATEPPVVERYGAEVSEPIQAIVAFAPTESLDVVEPQPLFAEILRECPRLRTDNGVAFFRMEDVVEAGRNPAIVSELDVAFEGMGSREALIPLHVDGDRHTRYRKILDPLLTPRNVAPLEPKIRALANSLIDGFIDAGQVELHDAFAVPLPSQTFLELFGLPVTDSDLLVGFKDEILKNSGATLEEHNALSVAAGDELKHYLDGKIAEREGESGPRDDLLGACMSYVTPDGARLTRDEIMNIAHLFVIAGLDTVTASLTCIIGWFARHPDVQQRVIEDPSLLPGAIEELMRYENPVLTGGPRMATSDTEVNGVPVKAGDMVALCWTTANLDPDAFSNPLEVDIERTGNRHIAFAAGRHRCLGSHLARLELRTAIGELHRRVGRYWITEGDTPRYNHAGVRAAEHLPLSFEVRARP